MSIRTLNIFTIAEKWREVLYNSAELEDYCITNFGKKPTIYIGLDQKLQIGEERLPAITIYPLGKVEGLNMDKQVYGMFCGWDILHDEIAEGDNLYQFEGMRKSTEFGQILFTILAKASPSNPISEATFEYGMEWAPRWPGWFAATIEITPPLGGFPIEY